MKFSEMKLLAVIAALAVCAAGRVWAAAFAPEYGGEIADAVVSGDTVTTTLAKTAKAGDTLVTLSGEGTLADTTFMLNSPNTFAESLFFRAAVANDGKSATLTYKEGVYVWTGDNGDSKYGTAGNWNVVQADGSTTTATSYPTASNYVVVPNSDAAAVSINIVHSKINTTKTPHYMGALYIERDVKFYGDYSNSYNAQVSAGSIIEGPGVLSLENSSNNSRSEFFLASGSTSGVDVYCDIIAAGLNEVSIQAGGENGAILRLHGSLSGSTKTRLVGSVKSNCQIHFYGDCSGYTGSMGEYNGTYGYDIYFHKPGTFGATLYLGYSKGTIKFGEAGTYTFNSIRDSKANGSANDLTLVTGAGDTTDSTITFTAGAGTETLVYEGNYTLSVTSGMFDQYSVTSVSGRIKLPPETSTTGLLATGTEVKLSDDTGVYLGKQLSPEEILDAKQIVVAAGNTLTISNTSGCGSSGTLSLSEPYAITGAGGCLFGANTLTLNEGGILVLDPPCVPVKMNTAPTLNGGKFALAAKYKHNTVGKFTLLTWTDGSDLSVTADNFTNTTSAASFSLSVEDGVDTNVKQLVLTLGDWATAKKGVTILPIGDSITEGANVSSGAYTYTPNYRIPLWNKLAAAGYDVTSVGWLKTNPTDGAGVKAKEAWQSHSGRGGEKLLWWPESDSSKVRGAVRESLEALLDQAGEPDVILLKIGTNDIIHDNLAQDTYIASLTNVIWRALDYRPGAKIVVSTLVKLDTTDRTTLTQSYNEEIRKFAGVGNVYGFPADRVFVADNAPVVTGFNSDNVHPSWIGHNQMSDCWFTAVTNAIETTATLDTFAKTTTSGAANNVDESYRTGYKRAARLNLATDGGNFYLAKNTAITYDTSDAEAGAATENIARVGYYLELKRRGSEHRRWVWVDIPASAFSSRTLAGCGFPANYSKWGQVSGVHIASNDPAVHQVLPTDDSVSARLEFTSASYQTGVTSEEGAPSGYSSQFDWNDTTGSGSYGSFQIHRIFSNGEYFDCPAEVVFAFNHWSAESGNINEVGIGNFAQQVSKTIDYTLTGQADNTADAIPDGVTYSTMNAKAYDVISLEIWTKAGVALPAENYLWTGAADDGGKWSNHANWVNEDTGLETGYYPGEDDGTGNNYRAVFSNNVYTVDVDVDATIITIEMPEGTAGTTNLVTLTGSHTITLAGLQKTTGTTDANKRTNARYCNCYPGKYRYLTINGPTLTLNSAVSNTSTKNFIGINDKYPDTVNGQSSGILTIQNGAVNAYGMYANGSDALIVVNGGTLTIENDIQINNGAKFVVNNGTITAGGATLETKNQAGTIEIAGGSVTVNELKLAKSGDSLAITGGTFSASTVSITSGTSIEVGSGATITLPATQATTFYNKVTTFSVDPDATMDINLDAGGSVSVKTSDYYKFVANTSGVGGELVLDEAKVAPVPVTDGTKAPMDFGTSGKVAFNISNYKKGLYYGIASGVSELSLAYPATLVQCADETAGVTLEADLPESGATLFKIVVSDEQLAAEQ